jgi:hypothetical protein
MNMGTKNNLYGDGACKHCGKTQDDDSSDGEQTMTHAKASKKTKNSVKND